MYKNIFTYLYKYTLLSYSYISLPLDMVALRQYKNLSLKLKKNLFSGNCVINIARLAKTYISIWNYTHVQITSQVTHVALIFTDSSCTRRCETLCTWLAGTYSCYFLVKTFVTWFTRLHVLRFWSWWTTYCNVHIVCFTQRRQIKGGRTWE